MGPDNILYDSSVHSHRIAFAKLYPMGYNKIVKQIRQTEVYTKWFGRLKHRQARARVLARIRRLSLGNPGDVAPVGEGVLEMRIHYGPGYRVYYVDRGQTLIVLLAGGDKRSQKRDIRRAIELAKEL
jgi:putative addiction module killer protein